MERFKWLPQSLLGGGQDQEEDPLGEFEDGSCSLSPLQRLYGFAASLVVGLAFMLLSLVVFYKPIKFAIMFTFGNILAVGRWVYKYGISNSILMLLFLPFCLIVHSPQISCQTPSCGSTAFLIGPVQQARMMLDPVRIYATAVYVGSVILALLCALWIHSKVLTLIAIISEICALVW
ncbi:unnamed protein product [Musa textilis]